MSTTPQLILESIRDLLTAQLGSRYSVRIGVFAAAPPFAAVHIGPPAVVTSKSAEVGSASITNTIFLGDIELTIYQPLADELAETTTWALLDLLAEIVGALEESATGVTKVTVPGVLSGSMIAYDAPVLAERPTGGKLASVAMTFRFTWLSSSGV